MIDPLRRDRATASAPPRARAARPAQAPRARRDEAPAGGCLHDRRPAEDREAPDTEGRVRLHRRRGRGRDLACAGRARRSRTSSSTREVLRDVSTVDTSVTVLGGPSALPFGIAPTGFTRLMRTEGERAGAAAAGAAGIPFSLSTLGTTSIEDVARANPRGRNWFQLYMWKDRERVDGADRARRDSRLRHAARDRRRPRLGRPDPRPSQRPDDPARAPTPQRRRRAPPSALVDRLPHHRAARLRRPRRVAGHGRGVSRPDVRSERRLRRPRLDQGAVAGQARGEGRPDARGREAGRRGRCRRDHALEPRRPPARPGTRAVPSPPRRGARGRPGRRRSTSTPGS